MFAPDIHDLARKLVEHCAARRTSLVTAESCTGGLIAGALTEIPGASEIFERGFVTYGNEAKTEMLHVQTALLERFGAVSPEVVEAMAEGALAHSKADYAVAATGIAGPGGGTAAKPVGLVYIGLAKRGGLVFHYKCMFKGDRDNVRAQAVEEALKLLLTLIDD